jgi:hypothetical protein
VNGGNASRRCLLRQRVFSQKWTFGFAIRIRASMGSRMAQPIPTSQEVPTVVPPGRRAGAVIAMAGAGLGAALLLGALVLWFHYGTTVFFEMIASGIAACF